MNLSPVLAALSILPVLGACATSGPFASSLRSSSPNVVVTSVTPIAVHAAREAGGTERSVSVRARVEVRSNRHGDGIVGMPERITLQLRGAANDGAGREFVPVASTTLVCPSSIAAGGTMGVLGPTFDVVLDPHREYVIEARVLPDGRSKPSESFRPGKL